MRRSKRHERSVQSAYSEGGSAGVYNPRAKQRAICIAVSPQNQGEELDNLAELKELLRTAGVAVSGQMQQFRPQPNPNTYFGKGKLEELKREISSANANLVACDDELSPRQERNLEEALKFPVIDRTAIILDIFADHATSAEGKLQVELAQLEYNLARMRGLWTHLERLGGGIGTRGPGESQIETDRRLARDRIEKLKRRIERGKQRRHLIRKERDKAALPTISLAGYTNAGKSTLLNALTDADVSVGSRLFNTLDPTTRSFGFNGRKYLVTDTVGFIRKLPHQLVDAFAATLEETLIADIILHIADAAELQEEIEEKREAVDQVLNEIGAGSISALFVLNKVDLIDSEQLRELSINYPDSLAVSASEGSGIEQLKTKVEDQIRKSWISVELLFPFSEGKALSDLHKIAGELQREETENGVKVQARLPAQAARRFQRFRTSGMIL